MKAMRCQGIGMKTLIVCVSILLLAMGCQRRPDGPTPEEIQKLEKIISHNNLGIGYLEQFLYEKAAAEFRSALELDPEYRPCMINLGIAQFNQNENDAAIEQMSQVLERDPQNPHAHYVSGMANFVKNKHEESLKEFETLQAIVPDDPDNLFWLGKLYENQSEYDKAIASYKKAVELDPDKVSALYRIFQNLIRKARKQKDKAAEKEAKIYMERYNEARIGKPAVQENYLTRGKFAMAIRNPKKNPIGGEPSSVRFTAFKDTGIDFTHGYAGEPSPGAVEAWLAAADGTSQGGMSPEEAVPLFGSGVALLDYDNDGDVDLYMVNTGAKGKGAPNALYRNEGSGTFTEVGKEAGVDDAGQGMGAVVADYDNDGHADIYVTNNGPNVLYHNKGDSTFEPLEKKTGVAGKAWSLGAAFVDYDHDADVDLLVLNYRAPSSGAGQGRPDSLEPLENKLYMNAGDGTFKDVTEDRGLAEAAPNIGLVCT
ncbi:FG-GAP-like repeat-containing protein, partial [Acidobacteriota bacterium]